MASTPQAFWQTLLAATSTGLSEVLVGTTSLLSSVFQDVKPVETALGQTIDVPVPNSVLSQVSTATTGDPTFNDYTVNTVPISLNQHLQYGTLIRSFEQYNSPITIKDVLIDPGIKAVAMKANAYLSSLINTTNFNVNAPVSTTTSSVTPTQFVGGYQTLLQNLVNVRDSQNMTFLQAPAVYASQLTNSAWSQESIAGINVAQQARVEGGIKFAYGARQDVDQQLPVTGTTGSFVYTSIYMSRYAMAAVMRPLPKGDERVAYTTYIYWMGLPIRITLSWSGLKDAWLLNIDCGFGASVVRPEQAVLFSTAE